jgi:glycosyltransferase involved in cell wall biosynthesis
MNNKPFFSIITVNLNSGSLIQGTYNSVVTQKFKDFEYIIKDGGSTDKSLEFIKTINPNSVKIVINSDTGIFDAMNQSIDYVSGKYLLFLNSGDELLDSDVLFEVKNFIDNNNEVKLVYGDYLYKNSSLPYHSPKNLYKYTIFRNMLCHQSCFFATELFYDLKFNLDFSVAADYKFLLDILRKKVIYKYFPRTFVKVEPNGFSARNTPLLILDVKRARKQYFGEMFYVYNVINLLTFPRLRYKISKNRLTSKPYSLFVNFINRII